MASNMANVLFINGPNLNLLGTREPGLYGNQTLADIEETLTALGEELSIRTGFFQSNHEGALVDRIHQARDESVSHIILNPAAYTHTSVAIRDALLGVAIPFIEVHLSNVHKREAFRHHSYFSDIACGVICGFGPEGYRMALLAIANETVNGNE